MTRSQPIFIAMFSALLAPRSSLQRQSLVAGSYTRTKGSGTVTRRTLFAPDTFARRLTSALWLLRALWASMLLSPMVLYACAYWSTDGSTDAIASGFTWNHWNDPLPWETWLLATLLAAGSLVIPAAVDRRAIGRLRDRITYGVDPARPGHYRHPPGLLPQLSNVLLHAALARYAGRLALSFAMLGTIVLLFVLSLANPELGFWQGFHCSYVWKPIDYLPMVAVASLLIAAQLPTRQHMLRILVARPRPRPLC